MDEKKKEVEIEEVENKEETTNCDVQPVQESFLFSSDHVSFRLLKEVDSLLWPLDKVIFEKTA